MRHDVGEDNVDVVVAVYDVLLRLGGDDWVIGEVEVMGDYLDGE
ncbi:hypothetical protein [Staphylococcus aureus]|nr:hypothetical protein [Staphylococcus aureus]